MLEMNLGKGNWTFEGLQRTDKMLICYSLSRIVSASSSLLKAPSVGYPRSSPSFPGGVILNSFTVYADHYSRRIVSRPNEMTQEG